MENIAIVGYRFSFSKEGGGRASVLSTTGGENVGDLTFEPLVLKEDVREALENAEKLAQAWQGSAAHFSNGADYYRAEIVRCGKAIGKEAFIADDGSVSAEVLVAKVPELVEGMVAPIHWTKRFQRAARLLLTGKAYA